VSGSPTILFDPIGRVAGLIMILSATGLALVIREPRIGTIITAGDDIQKALDKTHSQWTNKQVDRAKIIAIVLAALGTVLQF